MAQLAFYKGKGTWLDAVIRWVTRSPYSHVELILDPTDKGNDGESLCFSSSARDGGVRVKRIKLNPDHWDIQTIEWPVGDHIERLFANLAGSKYDYWGLLFSQFFNWRRHSKTRWFCSEVIAFALGVPQGQRYSPGDLSELVANLNCFYHKGIRAGLQDV